MAALLKLTDAQFGVSATATNNFTWYQPASPDGTIRLGNGNSGSVTDVLTATSAGNVGIGTASPARQLEVSGPTGIARFTSTTGTNASYLEIKNTGGSNLIGNESSTGGTLFNGTGAYSFALGTVGSYPLSFSTANNERMRITSAGSVVINTTATNAKLGIDLGGVSTLGQQASQAIAVTGGGSNGNYCQIGFGYGPNTQYTPTAIGSVTTTQTGYTIADLVFATRSANTDTAPTERMRIDSNGYVSIGNTSASSRALWVEQAANAVGMTVKCTNGSFGQFVIGCDTTRAANSGFDLYLGQANGVSQFRVNGAGTIYAQNTSVQSISDVRMKENITDSDEGLNVISALRPVRFDFKEGFGNDRKNQLGFIAQEVEAVFPDAVDIWGESDDPEEPYKSVGPGALIPVLVKAIQELNAKVEAQAAEIATLKGNV